MNWKEIIPKAFEIIGVLFDKVPWLNKLKGYRSLIGLTGMVIVNGLDQFNIGPGNLGDLCNPYLIVFTGLALNASGRAVLKK